MVPKSDLYKDYRAGYFIKDFAKNQVGQHPSNLAPRNLTHSSHHADLCWTSFFYQTASSMLPTFRISTNIMIINSPKNNCIEYNTHRNILTFSSCSTEIWFVQTFYKFRLSSKQFEDITYRHSALYTWHNKLNAECLSLWQRNLMHTRNFSYFHPSWILNNGMHVYVLQQKIGYITQ